MLSNACEGGLVFPQSARLNNEFISFFSKIPRPNCRGWIALWRVQRSQTGLRGTVGGRVARRAKKKANSMTFSLAHRAGCAAGKGAMRSSCKSDRWGSFYFRIIRLISLSRSRSLANELLANGARVNSAGDFSR